MRALLLRGLFASDLFQLGGSSAVIAAGLAGYGSSAAVEALVRVLGSGDSTAEAVGAVRTMAEGLRTQSSYTGFPEEMAFASTALFTNVPWLGVHGP